MALSEPRNCWTHADKAISDAVVAAPEFVALLASVGIKEADAAKHVFGNQVGRPFDGDGYTGDELSELRAFAQVVSPEEPFEFRRINNYFKPFGRTVVAVQHRIGAQAAREDNRRGVDGDDGAPTAVEWEFKQRLGVLMKQLTEALTLSDSIEPTMIKVTEGPGFNPWKTQDENGKWQGAEITIEWGLA